MISSVCFGLTLLWSFVSNTDADCYYIDAYGATAIAQVCYGTRNIYCCGRGSLQYCCDYNTKYNTSDSETFGILRIIGSVISFIFFSVFVITILVCCCSAACPLYQRRQRWRTGGRIHQQTGQTVVVSQQQQMSHHGYGQRPQQAMRLHPQHAVRQPQPYNHNMQTTPFMQHNKFPQHPAPPPSYASPTDAAYPPPPSYTEAQQPQYSNNYNVSSGYPSYSRPEVDS